MIATADFLGYIISATMLAWLFGFFINGIFSLIKPLR